MVRCLGVLLVLAMLLCGCVQNTAEPTAPTDNLLQPDSSAPTGLYVPESAIEQATDGAVRAFSLKDGECYGAVTIGDELMLLYNVDGEGELVLCSGENLEEVKTIRLGKGVLPKLSQMQINEQGIGYYDSANKAVVFLTPDFVEKGRMYLPQDMVGDGWLSSDWASVHYCTASGVYTMDLQTGISRLLKAQNAFAQTITGSFYDGKVLRYVLELTEGNQQTMLIDGTTGLVMQTAGALDELTIRGGQYFLPQMIRGVRQLRFGSGDTHKVLWPAEETATPNMLFDNNAVVMTGVTEQRVNLDYYDLATGACYAGITLEGMTEVWGLQGDGAKGVWFFGRDASEVTTLYHWDSTKNTMENDKVYTQPLYSLEAPDEAGLEAVKNSADALTNKLGIKVLVWKDAVASVPENQAFTAEYRTQLYNHYLARLEKAMSNFPKKMLDQFKDLKIAMVQTITGNPEKGTLAQVDHVQYWNGKNAVVAVTLDKDFERNLYHGIYLYMESKILSKTNALYEWYRLNPKKFDYDNSYIINLERTDTTYITGGNRYFVDLFSMSYPKEDRATIFEYACMSDNAEYFQTKVMKEKLNRICKGIRAAYGLNKEETQFLWEQYK